MKTRSMYAKENIPLLRKVLGAERWFQVLLVSDLDKFNLGTTARILAEYYAPGPFPEGLISTAFTLAQEWADQLGQRVLVSARMGMGTPPMGLFYRSRKNHFNFRPAEPFAMPIVPNRWNRLAQPTGFLPVNCPFCDHFVPAAHYGIVHNDGTNLIVAACDEHREIAQRLYAIEEIKRNPLDDPRRFRLNDEARP